MVCEDGLLAPFGDPDARRGASKAVLAGDHPDVEVAWAWAVVWFGLEVRLEGTDVVYRRRAND